MPVIACRRCFFETTCINPNEADFSKRVRCVMGQLDWSLEQKLEELKRISRWIPIPPEDEVTRVHKECEQERERREKVERESRALV